MSDHQPSQQKHPRLPFGVDPADFEQVANIVLESLEEGYKAEGEPFEVYAQKLRSHIHTDQETFRQRFTDGYAILMEELDKKEKSSDGIV